MTALAMIIGMVPMALGFGEGGEQNAPLGRAVIGGLLFATVATLVLCPLHLRHGSRAGKAKGRNRHRSAILGSWRQSDLRSGTTFMDSEFELKRSEAPEGEVAAPPQIDPVPKLPPAKPRTAVLIVGVVLRCPAAERRSDVAEACPG